jgi:chromosome segregation ATPase
MKGRELKSVMLTTLAGQVEADPFGKIKTLISELIGRLNQEAADSADHKGWCDSSINKAKTTRDDKSEKIAFLNTVLEKKEIQRDKTTDRITTLAAEISDLEDVQAKFTKAREDEKAENENSIKEAEGGIDAINDALKVLKEFYDAAKDGGEISFAQQSGDPKKADDLPDTGFGGDYKGSQGAATGIIGMMEVILGDFERTIKITKQEEDKANRDFKDLKRSTEISLETKTSEKSDKESENADTKSKIDQAMNDLSSEQDLLDKAIQELIELQPACIDTGMTYEERVAKREQEIESLKQAVCLLEKHGPVKEETMSCEE